MRGSAPPRRAGLVPLAVLALAVLAAAAHGVPAPALAAAAAGEPSYPAPTAHVVDEAGLLESAAREHLEAVCRELAEKTGDEIAVALVPSIAPLDIEAYAEQLFRRWGVGKEKEDSGVLLVVARDERRVRVEVGYGLEGLLPDGRVGGILRGAVVPHLRRNDWTAGVTGGVEALAAIIARDRGVALATLGAGGRSRDGGETAARGRARNLATVLAVVIFLLVFGLVAAARSVPIGPYSRRRGRSGAWWIGPGGFGGGGFSGGGGGFGGFGGGMSGGGGASSGF